MPVLRLTNDSKDMLKMKVGYSRNFKRIRFQ
jgi:hypothetical protein